MPCPWGYYLQNDFCKAHWEAPIDLQTSAWICRQKWTLAFSWRYWQPRLFCSSINLPFSYEHQKEKCWRSFGESSLSNPSFFEIFIISLFHPLYFFVKTITLNTMEWNLTFIIWTYETDSLNLELEIHLCTWVDRFEVIPSVTEKITRFQGQPTATVLNKTYTNFLHLWLVSIPTSLPWGNGWQMVRTNHCVLPKSNGFDGRVSLAGIFMSWHQMLI